MRIAIGGELFDSGVKSRLYSAYKNARLSLSNLYGPMGMFASSNSGARNMERAAQSEWRSPMAPRGLFDRPMIEEGSKGKTSPALLFGVVAATVIALMVLIGVSGKNDASHVAQQNAVTSTSQN